MGSRPSHIAWFLLFVACSLVVHALDPSGNYAQGPVDLGDNTKLWYGIDYKAKTASLALKVADPAIVKDAAEPNWLGLGVSEPSSGSMLGSDIITVEFAASQTDKCTVKDRYVPFAAFPLINSTSQSPAVYPREDTCQGDGSWTLIRCVRDPRTAQMVMEVTRPLDAHDAQDRAIGPNQQNIIYAYGSSFQYHNSARGSKMIALYDSQGTVLKPAVIAPLPADVTANQSFTATQFSVPADDDTTYACTSFTADLGPNEQRMVVAAEQLMQAKSGKLLVHHLVVHACTDSEYFRGFQKTQRCGYKTKVPGPTGYGNCSNVLFAWAKGGSRFVLPAEAGFLLTNQNKFLIMETHYSNPDLVKGAVDQSGVTLFYTDKLRQHEAGVLNTGDPTVSLSGSPVVNNKTYQFTCPSQCTQNFREPVNVFASFLHMHLTGKKIYENRFAEDGKFLETVNSINYWSNDFQITRTISPAMKVNPGDAFSLTCVYDTSKTGKVVFGARTQDEMCMDFMFYWPVQRRKDNNDSIHLCGFFAPNSTLKGAVSICGNGASLESALLPLPNPTVKDTNVPPENFGSRVSTCQAESSSNSSNNKCFPGLALVTMQDGSEKMMKDLQVGDIVLVGPRSYSAVFMFTHKVSEVRSMFTRIGTADGRSILLSHSHFLYVNGILKQASSTRPGDALTRSDGRESIVTFVSSEFATGLYNPQTIHGDIVVSGFITSTYTGAVEPQKAHAVLSPLRYLFLTFGASLSAFELGGDRLVNLMSKWNVI